MFSRLTLPAALLAASQFLAPAAVAADAAAGKAKAAAVCAACHGATGVSVADHIPNLAGQKSRYIEGQLRALKDGSRKNDIMNAIAGQLSEADIANVAAHFSAQPGAAAGQKSEFLANVVKTHIVFPDDYKATYTKYYTMNVPEAKQVKVHYISPAAAAAAKAGKPLPDGSAIVVETYLAKLDADKKPLTAADGTFVPDRLVAYVMMASGAGWGDDIPDMLRNGNWNYAIFNAEKQLRTNVNQAECLACHKPIDKSSYVFTLSHLTGAAKS